MPIQLHLPIPDAHWLITDACLAAWASAVYGPEFETWQEHVAIDKDGEQFAIAWDDQAVVLAIRGSDEPIDWVRNISLYSILVEFGTAQVKLHRGFHSAARIVWTAAKTIIRDLAADGRKVYACGHSKGGATAAVLPLLSMSEPWHFDRVATFGAPAWILDGYGPMIDEVIEADTDLVRYVNELDPVPHWPKSYEQAGHVRYLTKAGVRSSRGYFSTIRRLCNSAMGKRAMARQHDHQQIYLARTHAAMISWPQYKAT